MRERCNYALLGFNGFLRKLDGDYFFSKKLRCYNLTFELFLHSTHKGLKFAQKMFRYIAYYLVLVGL